MLSLLAGCSLLCLLPARQAHAQVVPATSAASQYALATSTSIPFPTATLANTDTQSFLVANWGLSKGKIQNGAADLAFVADPFPNSPVPTASTSTSTSTGTGTSTSANASAPVLRVTYPEGSFKDDNSGGAQMYALWNASAAAGGAFRSMMLSYEVAFDAGFDWVKGGKLPGLRGGPDPNGCSGGHQPNGSDCFSARLMWRKNGAGEVYAYILRPNSVCDSANLTCNDDFGVSISRGSFSFASGQWNRVTLLVRLNSPVNVANGQVTLYYNDIEVLSQDNLQIRSSDVVTAGGLYFSTFFGGSDASWAATNDTHTYFRNMLLWGSSAPSDLAGATVSGARATRAGAAVHWALCVAAGGALLVAGAGVL